MDRDPGRPPLAVVTGVCGSGKTTVGRLLAARFPSAAFVEGDVLRRMVVSGRHEMTADPSPAAIEALRLRHRQTALLGESFRTAGRTVVVEDVFLDELPYFLRQISSGGVHVFVLAPDVGTLLARDAGREKTAYGEGRWDAHALDRELRSTTPRIGLWIDTSAQDAADTTDEIMERFDEGAVDTARLG